MTGPLQFLFDENIIISLQSQGNSFIDFFFIAVTVAGNQASFFLLATLIFWCYDKKLGIRALYLILLSAFAALYAKTVFSMQRPPDYLHKIPGNDYGFPSGHAQVSSSFWGYLGFKMKYAWLIVMGTAAILLISLSRVYLGVHYVGDVIGGIGMGISIAVLFSRFEPNILNVLQRLEKRLQYILAAMLPCALILLAFLQHGLLNEQIKVGLVMVAVGIGYLLEEEYIRIEEPKDHIQRIKRAFVGVLLFAVIYGFFFLVFFKQPYLTALQYTALGFASTFLAPWVFTRMEHIEAN